MTLTESRSLGFEDLAPSGLSSDELAGDDLTATDLDELAIEARLEREHFSDYAD